MPPIAMMKHQTPETIRLGRRLALLRVQSRLTQKEVAARMRVSESSIHDIERGRFRLKVSTMERFVNACGCKLKIEFKKPEAIKPSTRVEPIMSRVTREHYGEPT